jgi:hypothetical protein
MDCTNSAIDVTSGVEMRRGIEEVFLESNHPPTSVPPRPHSSTTPPGTSFCSFPIPKPSQATFPSGGSSFLIPTQGVGSGSGGASQPQPGGGPATFSSFPGASSFKPPAGGLTSSSGGVEGAILEKMKRAAERERMLAAVKAEAAAEEGGS